MKPKVISKKFTLMILCSISLFFNNLVCANPDNNLLPDTDEILHNRIRQELISDGYEKFKEKVYKEPFENGVYIVNGDTPISDEKKLREYYDSAIVGNNTNFNEIFGNRISEKITYGHVNLDKSKVLFRDGFLSKVIQNQKSILINIDAPDGIPEYLDKFQKLKMTYCVSKDFKGRYSNVVEAFAQAAASWEQASNVKFQHISKYDDTCNETSDVRFDIRPIHDRKYYARAFFPKDNRLYSNVLIDDTSFEPLPGKATLVGILKHEIGHTLAFRHEQITPQPGKCFEKEPWVQLNEVDPHSIMRYPDCSTDKSWSLELTEKDKVGAACLYGPSPGKSFDRSQCNWKNQ